MLIFVDKKKEKQRRIKILYFICVILFIVVANIFHFKKALNYNNKKLATYQTIVQKNDWYDKSKTVYLLLSQQENAQTVIIIPKKINRENITTLAWAFSKIKDIPAEITLTPEISDSQIINELAEVFFPLATKEDHKQKILISSDLDQVKDTIMAEHLYPLTLNYKHTKKINNHSQFMQFLDKNFPAPPKPKNKQEQEKRALQEFAMENISILQRITLEQKTPEFSHRNLLLKSVRFCLQDSQGTACNTDSNSSFIKNLNTLLQSQRTKIKPKKLILLTSDELIENIDSLTLEADEGLHFQFQKREAFLLPEEIQNLKKTNKAIYVIKQKAGLNPKYTTSQMKFYKFKTTEVILDEKI